MKQHKNLGSIRGSFMILLPTLLLTGNVLAEGDASKGKILLDKSQCQKCHSSEIFSRDDRKVKDLESLEKQVRLCDSQLSVNWFDDEISDVVSYLNETFYHFEKAEK